MVVSGDAQRVAAETGPKTQPMDSELDYEGLSGPAQHVLHQYKTQMSIGGISAGLAAGLLLVYAGLDFPYAERVIKGIKDIRLDAAFRGVALIGGSALVAQNWGGA